MRVYVRAWGLVVLGAGVWLALWAPHRPAPVIVGAVLAAGGLCLILGDE